MGRARTWVLVASLLLALAVSPGPAMGVAALDTEPNDTPAASEWLFGSTSGTLSSADELDVYHVACVAGESLEAYLSHDFASTGEGDFDLYLFARFTTGVETETPLVFSAEGSPASSEYLRYRIPPGGTGDYYVVVRAFESTAEAVPYELTACLDDVPTALSGVQRYAGADRYGTSVEISRRTFADGACPAAVIASGKGFADALSGSGLAGAVGGPLLLTDPAALSVGVWEELARLGVGTVYVVGGSGAVSDDVYLDLELGGMTVERIAGATRYDTAVAVAEKMDAEGLLDGAVHEAFVVYGGNFPDALAASPIAYAQGIPILLTPKGALDTAARTFLAGRCDGAYVVGGEGVVSETTFSQVSSATGAAERIAGADRYQTARAVGERFAGPVNGFGFVGIAMGANYPDALSGGAATGYEGGVLLLTPSDALNETALGMLGNMAWGDDAAVFGGVGAVSAAAMQQAEATLRLLEP